MLLNSKFLNRSLLSFSNIGRGLLLNIFGLVLNSILIHYNSIEILNMYVYFISIFSLFNILTNWGGKFFNNKELSNNLKQSKNLISNLISSKIILVLLSVLIILFVNLEIKLKILLILFLLLKSINPIFDSLILYKKKSQLIFISEFFINTCFLILLFLFGQKFDYYTLLSSLVVLELIKFLYFLFLFNKEISFRFSLSKALKLLKKSIPFFLLSLVSFIASKSELYIVGILIDKKTMSIYFIISSLLSISMVIYASMIGAFETSIHRFGNKSFLKFENSLFSFNIIFSILASIGFNIISNYFYNISIDLRFTLLFFVNLYLFTKLNFEMYRFTKFEKQNIILIVLIIAGISNCVFSFLLIKKLSLFGAFLSNTLALSINYISLLFYHKKKLKHES